MPTLLATKPALGATLDYGHPLVRGLRGDWPMNEAAGGLVHDSVSGHHLTLTPTTRWAPDGIAVVSGNNDGALATAAASALAFTAPVFSVRVAFFPTAYADNYGRIMQNATTAATGGFDLEFDGGDDAVSLVIWNGTGLAKATSPVLPLFRWYDIVGTYDGAFARLYSNGVLVGGPTAATMTVPDVPQFSVGQYPGGGNTPTAQIKYAQYWGNRVLFPADAAQLYVEPFCMMRSPDRWRRYYTSPGLAISGTATAGIDEDDIVAGGKTIIATLNGYQWPA